MDEQQGGDDIAHGDGLERIGEGMEQFPVPQEQVPLYDPAQEKEQEKTSQELPVERSVGPGPGLVPGHGEGDGDAGHEQEQRHDEVPGDEAFPGHVLQLVGKPAGTVGKSLAQAPEDGSQHQQQEHVGPAKDVQGFQAFFHGRSFSVISGGRRRPVPEDRKCFRNGRCPPVLRL